MCFGPRIFEKQERRTVIGSLHLCFVGCRVVISHNHFRQPAKCLRSDLGLVERAQQISDHSFSSTAKPVANMNKESDCRLSPDVVSIFTNEFTFDQRSGTGNFLRSHNHRFEMLPEDMQVIKSSHRNRLIYEKKDFSWNIFRENP